MITLLTDFGEKSINVARSKAWINKEIGDQEVLDISHCIHPNDINEAAYVFNLIVDQLSLGTFCLVAVDFDKRIKQKEIISFEHRGITVITYNSGFGTVLTNNADHPFIYLTDYSGFHSEAIVDCFGVLCKKLLERSIYDQPMLSNDELNIKMPLRPVTKGQMLQGHIIYIDSLDNCYTNISIDVFEQFANDSAFKILLSRHEQITKIWSQLEITEGGSTYCYFNAAGFLTISVYRGSAKKLYALSRGHNIIIEKS